MGARPVPSENDEKLGTNLDDDFVGGFQFKECMNLRGKKYHGLELPEKYQWLGLLEKHQRLGITICLC